MDTTKYGMLPKLLGFPQYNEEETDRHMESLNQKERDYSQQEITISLQSCVAHLFSLYNEQRSISCLFQCLLHRGII